VKTITIEIPENLAPAVAESEEGLPRAFRLAAAIQWYSQGLISQGKGAEIAGLTRAGFIDALGRAKVDALQTTAEELKAELARAERERTVAARR
jgi:predicted HTH domain antitoxin